MEAEKIEIDNFDDFIAMPGADDIVTNEKEATPVNNIFKGDDTDLSFLEETKEENSVDEDLIAKTLEDIDIELGLSTPESEDSKGRRKIDKSGLVDTFSTLIKEGVIVGFEDDKPLEEYTMNDFKELIQSNLEEKERVVREQTPKEFFEQLPQELQYAAEYVANGGKDMKTLFAALAQVEQVRELDPSDETHQEAIARQYLQATGFGDSDLIEEQIEEWLDAGLLAKKANQFKPKLDEMQEEVVQAKIAQQEIYKREQTEKRDAYVKNIFDTLKPGSLNGVKIDDKRRMALWEGLTHTKYNSLSGKPTNLLGNLLEQYQFGKNPRYDLIAEATWLLSDPDDYKEHIKKQAENKVITETVRKLKTEEARKSPSTHIEEKELGRTSGIKRKVPNIFAKQ